MKMRPPMSFSVGEQSCEFCFWFASLPSHLSPLCASELPPLLPETSDVALSTAKKEKLTTEFVIDAYQSWRASRELADWCVERTDTFPRSDGAFVWSDVSRLSSDPRAIPAFRFSQTCTRHFAELSWPAHDQDGTWHTKRHFSDSH